MAQTRVSSELDVRADFSSDLSELVIRSWNSDGEKNISPHPRVELEEGSNLGYSPKLRKSVVSRKKEEMVVEMDVTNKQMTPSRPSLRPLPGSLDKRKYLTPTRRLNVETPKAPKSRWNGRKKKTDYIPPQNQQLISSMFKKNVEGVKKLDD